MGKLWLVAKREFLLRVSRRTFLVTTFAVPLGFAALIAVGVFIAIKSAEKRPVGYVDNSGVLDPAIVPSLNEIDDTVEIRVYQDVSVAQIDLESGDIQAYFVLPEDYRRSQQVAVYYWEEKPGDDAWEAFNNFLRVNLLAGLPEDRRQRVLEEPEWTVRSVDGRRQVTAGIGILNLILPFIASFIFYLSVMTSGGYLLQAIADEKENRTIEVMVTSLTPEQLIGGKTAGLLAVVLTQLTVWIITIVIALITAATMLESFPTLSVPWSFLLVVALYLLPTFVLIAGIMTAIGVMVTEAKQGNQIAGVINLAFMAPWFLSAMIFTNPDHPVLVILTIIPFSAFLTTAMRWSITAIPAWQLIVSWLLLVASAGFSLWGSARIFRLGMLRYGKQFSLRTALGALRNRRSWIKSGGRPSEVS
ncbi:MAG: ABC transporter permease [Anaerolineales bacterium]